MTLLESLKALQSVEGRICKDQSVLLAHIDSLELCSVPDYPHHFLVDIASFEELARLAGHVSSLHTQLKERLQQVVERVNDIPMMVRVVKGLKNQLKAMTLKIQTDSQHFHNSIKRVSTVLNGFRSRCKQDFAQFLKELDTDIRTILKPLVPSEAIRENLRFPSIGQSVHSSIASDDLESDEVSSEALTKHINMLVSTLEKVAKQLVDLLEDARRKYFEFVDPVNLGATPLAAALPEYFSYEQVPQKKRVPRKDKDSIKMIKERISDLCYSGELTQPQAESLQKHIESGKSYETLFNELNFSLSKQEDLVFKLITPIPPNRQRRVESVMLNSGEARELQKAHFSAPRTEKLKRAPGRPKHGLIRRSEKKVSRLPELAEPSPPAYPMPATNARKDLRARSVTPTDWSTRSVKNKNIKFLIKH